MCRSSGTEGMGGQTQAWLPVFPSTLTETESLSTAMYSINQRAELQLAGNLLFPLAILHELLELLPCTLCGLWGFELRSSWLCNNHFTHWVISLAQIYLLLKAIYRILENLKHMDPFISASFSVNKYSRNWLLTRSLGVKEMMGTWEVLEPLPTLINKNKPAKRKEAHSPALYNFGTFSPNLLQTAICASLLFIINVTLDWVASQKRAHHWSLLYSNKFSPSSLLMYEYILCQRHHENKPLHSLTIKSEASISHLMQEGILAIVSWLIRPIVLLVMFTWKNILISTLIRKHLIVHLCFVINPKSKRTLCNNGL